MVQKIFSFFKIGMASLVLLTLSACWVPVYLPKTERADAQPEYRTKYFTVKPAEGRWIAEISTHSTPSFMVPLEGNILPEVMSEGIVFWRVPSFTPIFPLKYNPALTIFSHPVLETIPEIKKGVKIKLIKDGIETYEIAGEVKIGNKTLYELKPENFGKTLWYFTRDRAYEFGAFDIFNRERRKMDSELVRVIESFEPLDFKASKEALLLGKALIVSRSLREHSYWRYDHLRNKFQYNFEETTRIYQDVINENPNNYAAHLFLGIHYLTAKEDFYKTIIAPKIYENPEEIIHEKIKRIGDAKQVLTKNMEKFDIYRLNIIWIVNKKDFYSYFLHGNFDDKAAIAEFKKALEIKPDSYAARYFLSWLYLRTGEYEKAASEYKKLLEKDPQDADALLMLSAAYRAMGLEKEAKESYDPLKRVTRTGTLYDFLDNFLGPALTSSLHEAISHAICLK